MMIKLVAILVVIYLTEGTHSSIVVGISRSTRIKLEHAINDTIEAKRQSAVEVEAIRNLIERKIDVALEPIDKDLKKLKCAVKKAEKRAKESEEDIKECVQKEKKAVHGIDKEIVRQCRETRETIAGFEKLVEIEGLIRALREAPNNCANKGLLANTCVITIIDYARQKTLVKQNEISVILRHTDPDERNKCITDGIEELQNQVDKVTDDWYECLQGQDSSSEKAA